MRGDREFEDLVSFFRITRSRISRCNGSINVVVPRTNNDVPKRKAKPFQQFLKPSLSSVIVRLLAATTDVTGDAYASRSSRVLLIRYNFDKVCQDRLALGRLLPTPVVTEVKTAEMENYSNRHV